MKKCQVVFATMAILLSGCITTNRSTEESEHAVMSKRIAALKAEGPRKRVLLLPFINDSIEKDAAVPKTGRDALVIGLRSTDNFIIIDNGDIPRDLKQYKKENGWDVDEIAKVAASLGVVAVIEGRVLEVKVQRSGDEVGLLRKVRAEVQATVGVRVFSAASHKEILSEVRTATSEARSYRTSEGGSLAADPGLIKQSLVSAFQGMVFAIVKAVDKLSWNGKIAMVQGDRIYLNAGRLTGLSLGDILRVNEEGNEIYDPDSGVLIGKVPGRMKGTLEVVSYFGKDGSIAIVHSGSGFKENDIVDLY